MFSHNSQETRNPYDYEPTPASAEVFWLTVAAGVHGKLKKPTATGWRMLAFSGFRYGISLICPPQAEIFEDIRTFLKRTCIILDVQIALNMKKNGARG